jgi:hypothetical protein
MDDHFNKIEELNIGLSPLLAPQLSSWSNLNPPTLKSSGVDTPSYETVQLKRLGAFEAICADVRPVLTVHIGIDRHVGYLGGEKRRGRPALLCLSLSFLSPKP